MPKNPRVTINGKPLIWRGRSLKAGDIERGTLVTFDPKTGKVLDIDPLPRPVNVTGTELRSDPPENER